jgi:5-methyltetrahydrofolate--homocysteine methyltransferase
MSDRLQTLLAARPWLLADGATGTNFFAAGLETGDSPELWNLEQPEKVQNLARAFVAAGSDIVLTNSFGGSRNRLRLHKAEDRVGEINARAARLAREVADAAGRAVVVAGSMGPTGDLFEPLGPLTLEAGTAAFAEQAKALAEGGADVLWIETISSVEELTAAVTGAATNGLPIVCTFSFDTNGRTMMGVTPARVAEMMHEVEPKPVAYGGNCGTGASELMAAVLGMSDTLAPSDVLVAKSNCGVPEYVDGHIQYSGTPELMADYARLCRDAGVRIIGGCCGTTPAHIEAMHAALRAHEPADKPDLDQVVARLGKVSAGTLRHYAAAEQSGTPGHAPGGEIGAGRRRGGRRKR